MLSLIHILLVLLFFTLSTGKRKLYIYPAVFAWALLVAAVWPVLFERWKIRWLMRHCRLILGIWIVLLIGAGELAGNARVKRLHHDGACAPFDATLGRRDSLDDIGRAALGRFDPQVIAAHAARGPDVLIDVVAALGMLRVIHPLLVFEIIACSWHPLTCSRNHHSFQRLLGFQWIMVKTLAVKTSANTLSAGISTLSPTQGQPPSGPPL